jgi:hypothetical protein
MPYRDERPLAEIIAPDRRREKTVALVVGGMIAGIALYAAATRWLAATEVETSAPVEPETPAPGETKPAEPGPFDSEAVVRVVRGKEAEVRRACWSRAGGRAAEQVDVRIKLDVGADGHVTAATPSGNDAAVGACVASVMRGATFPAPRRPTSVDVPFHFVRE